MAWWNLGIDTWGKGVPVKEGMAYLSGFVTKTYHPGLLNWPTINHQQNRQVAHKRALLEGRLCRN